jgi:hypothetical protein
VFSASAAEVDAGRYLPGANAAFGHWGDEKTFDWAFRQTPGGRPPADILFTEAAGRVVAGSAIVHRTLRAPTGEVRPVAIMAGSWTLPEARGTGAFTRMARETADIARSRGALLLAFVRAENGSRRRLEALGAGMHRAAYGRSSAPAAPGGPPVLDTLDPEPALFPPGDGTGIAYDAAAWRHQFLDRPGAHVECVGRRGEWAALVETRGGADQVHLLSDHAALAPLLARAGAAGRRLLCYATTEPRIDALRALGFEVGAGFVAALPPPSLTDWSFQNGDRM